MFRITALTAEVLALAITLATSVFDSLISVTLARPPRCGAAVRRHKVRHLVVVVLAAVLHLARAPALMDETERLVESQPEWPHTLSSWPNSTIVPVNDQSASTGREPTGRRWNG